MTPGRDLDWDEAIAGAPRADCVPVAATDPLYILYTSGTTGQPKGIVRDNGGHAVALRWSMEHVYDVAPGEVYWAASDVGWVVGHSYICYAPLLNGNTTIVYEGKPVGTPDPGAFWRVIAQHGVVCLFTAPTAFRAIKKEDPDGRHIGRHDLSRFRTLFLAGERCDPDTLRWAEAKLQRPVIDHWWQTETGWAIAANCWGIEQLPVKAGSPTKAVPGYEVRVLDEAGDEKKPGEIGNIVVKLPLPPGNSPTLWQNDQRYVDSYLSRYDGYYLTGDAGYRDEDGYLYVMSRIDDVINVAGHRLSTGAMEEVLAAHPDVAECAVFGVADELKGELPLGLVVLKAGVDRPEAELQAELIQRVREEIGPVAAFKLVAAVARLPKTRSGKILRGTMKSIADGRAAQGSRDDRRPGDPCRDRGRAAAPGLCPGLRRRNEPPGDPCCLGSRRPLVGRGIGRPRSSTPRSRTGWGRMPARRNELPAAPVLPGFLSSLARCGIGRPWSSTPRPRTAGVGCPPVGVSRLRHPWLPGFLSSLGGCGIGCPWRAPRRTRDGLAIVIAWARPTVVWLTLPGIGRMPAALATPDSDTDRVRR